MLNLIFWDINGKDIITNNRRIDPTTTPSKIGS